MSDDQTQPEGSEILDCQWVDIKDVVERAEVLLLSDDVVLKDVADALAKDEVAKVKAWLDEGAIQKLNELSDANDRFQPGDQFQLIIVTPFALIKPR